MLNFDRHSCAAVALVYRILLTTSPIPLSGARFVNSGLVSRNLSNLLTITVFSGLRAYALTQHPVLSICVFLLSNVQLVLNTVRRSFSRDTCT